MNRLRKLALLAVPTILIGTLTAPAALADPLQNQINPSSTPAVGWGQLGLSDELVLLGDNQRNYVEVPVPEGVTPMTLSGQIGSVVDAAAGRVDVLDSRGTFLGAINAPTALASEPFTVNISAAEVTDNTARLSFVLRNADAPANSCAQVPSITLSQLSTSYSGASPNPRTVSDFLPGYLDRVNVRVGPNPSPSQQQAALNLVAHLTDLYRPIPVRVDVDTSGTPADPVAGSSRVIEIRDGGKPGLSVENGGTPAAALVISGNGEDLVRQVDLFADRRAKLAQSDSASVVSATSDSPQSSNTLTFAQLGVAGEASVLGTTTLYTGFDIGEFGTGQIQHARLHLLANYTPVTEGEGSLLIRAGSTILASRSLDGSGTVDLTADIPAEAVASNIGLGLELRYVPRHECAPLSDRMTFALDPRSTLTVTPGTHNRGGFPVLPMAFTPDVDVAVNSPDQIRYAAQAINLMGQQSAVALSPRLVTFDDAAASRTPLITVATGDEMGAAGMSPPLLPGAGTTVGVNGKPVTDIDLGGPLGIVQAFTAQDRSVLAINATGDWSLVDRSFDYIRGLDRRWASLTGDVVATGADGDTVNLVVRSGGPMPYEPHVGDTWKWWATLSAGAAVLIVAAATAILVIRRRRTRA